MPGESTTWEMPFSPFEAIHNINMPHYHVKGMTKLRKKLINNEPASKVSTMFGNSLAILNKTTARKFICPRNTNTFFLKKYITSCCRYTLAQVLARNFDWWFLNPLLSQICPCLSAPIYFAEPTNSQLVEPKVGVTTSIIQSQEY